MSLPQAAGSAGSPAPRQRAELARRQLFLVRGGLALGVVTFVAVVAVLVGITGLSPGGPLPPLVSWGLVAASGVALVLGRVLRPGLQRAPPRADAETVASRWVSGGTVAAALAELPGMVGGVLGLMNGELLLMGVLALVSVVAILSGDGDAQELEQRLRRLPGA